MLEKFPNLEDFDLIGTKYFIRHGESAMWSLDDAVERYKDISKFLILDPRPNGQHRGFSHEVKIFRERIHSYKDKDYEVYSLVGRPNRGFTPEIEYGVVCKKLNECGIYSFFAGDDKTYYSYHRSDPTFTKTDVMVTF